MDRTWFFGSCLIRIGGVMCCCRRSAVNKEIDSVASNKANAKLVDQLRADNKGMQAQPSGQGKGVVAVVNQQQAEGLRYRTSVVTTL